MKNTLKNTLNSTIVVMIFIILVGCTKQPTNVDTSNDELLDELQLLIKDNQMLVDKVANLEKMLLSIETSNQEELLREDNQMLVDKVANLEKILLSIETSYQEESVENSNVMDLEKYYSVLNEELKFDVDDPDGLYHHYKSKVLDGDYEMINLDYYIEQVSGFLNGYEVYYERTWKTLDPAMKDIIESNDRFKPAIDIEMNNYYFSVKAAIRDYSYIMNKLDLSNAIKDYEDGNISIEVLDAKLQKYQNAKEEYEEFIGTAHSGD